MVSRPLWDAICFGRTDISKFLLSHGAHYANALIDAAKYKRHKIAALLLEHGAEIQDPSKPWEPKESPIATAIYMKDPDTLKVILNYSYTRDVSVPFSLLFNTALSNKDERCAMCLLWNGYHPITRGSNQIWEPYTSCFHMAAEKEMVKLMCLIMEFNPQCTQEEWLTKKQFEILLKYYLRKHRKFVAMLAKCRKQPRSLQKCCKSVILAQLEVYYPQKIKELPLPKVLKKFLTTVTFPK